MRSILFVCTASICRSPLAEGVLRSLLGPKGIETRGIHIDTAATHDFQVGHRPDKMAIAVGERRGYRLPNRPARTVTPGDFDRFDHILVMDRANLAHLRAICPTRCKQKIELLLDYGDAHHGMDVPDPYGGQRRDYERALDMIEDGCQGIAMLLSRAA